MPDDGEVHAYETRLGVFCVGVPTGQKRPAIWIVLPTGEPYILGRFENGGAALALVALLDAAFDDINRVIAHYTKLNGETPE